MRLHAYMHVPFRSASNAISFSPHSFGFQYQLRKASLSEDEAFAFLKGDNCVDSVTYFSFSEALRKVLSQSANIRDKRYITFQWLWTYNIRTVADKVIWFALWTMLPAVARSMESSRC